MLCPTEKYTDNQLRLLGFIRERAQFTRAELAKASGLSVLTVTKSVAQFLTDGLICEYGKEESTGGRKPIMLRLDPELGYALSVDIGAHSVKIGIINTMGIVLRREYIYDENTGTQTIPSFIITPLKLAVRLKTLMSEYSTERCMGVGFGISGIVNMERDSIVFCPNVAGWDNFNIIEFFRHELGIPVFLDTSARCMAMGEQCYGGAADTDNFILVSIGYSIAAGIVADGRMFRGGNGSAGELGHTRVKDDGQMCTCGNDGCLELFATVPMIVSKIKESLECRYESSLVKKLAPVLDDIDIQTVIKAYELGDNIVCMEIKEIGRTIGVALANMSNLLNPSKIILSGGLADALPIIRDIAESTVRTRCLGTAGQRVPVEISALGRDCAIIGCATQVLNNFFGK